LLSLSNKGVYIMRYVPEYEAIEQYEAMLDECYGRVEVVGMHYDTSTLLKEVDPIAYRCWFNDWCDSEDITTDEDEADEE
jgi:hypothetical protein